MSFTYVGKKYTVEEFAKRCESLPKQTWVQRIVLHNTGSPSLAQRPGGILTQDHIKNLYSFYANTQKWSGGPHLFIDATGIWEFNPLNDPGVHSPSYNSSSWGVEMLGDYSVEPFNSGLGLAVAKNAHAAIAILAQVQGWKNLEDGRMILHKEDPKTTHDCPGKNVNKADFIAKADGYMSTSKVKIVFEGKEVELSNFTGEDNKVYVPIRDLATLLGFKVDYDAKTSSVMLSK